MANKRSREYQKRRRKQLDHRPSAVQLYVPTLPSILRDTYASARTMYPMLLGIHECIPDIYARGNLLPSFGYDSWEIAGWHLPDDDYIAASERKDGNFAGHVTAVRQGDGPLRCIIFLRRPLGPKPEGVLLVELFHELGHVDDLAKGINLVPGQMADPIAAEEYAHHHACNQIMEDGQRLADDVSGCPREHQAAFRAAKLDLYRVMMAFYAGEALPQAAASPHRTIQQAAVNVLQSSEYARYTKFAGEHLASYTDGSDRPTT